jgi:hypothetical protein
MSAAPVLALVARILARHRLDAVLIGNAAAALHGSPVTTQDLDFMFRKTPANLRKLRRIADDLGAVVLIPWYPASGLYRVTRERDALQLDFMAKLDGIRTFEGLRSRASPVRFGRHEPRVAALEDVIRSKEAARTGRRTVPFCPCSGERCVKRVALRGRRRRTRSALRRESDRALTEQIRRLLALPMARRTHCLRRRAPGGESSL